MFHEFPKAIYPAEGGQPVLAESAEHEAAIVDKLGRKVRMDAVWATYNNVNPLKAALDAAYEESHPVIDTIPDPAPRRRGRPPRVLE